MEDSEIPIGEADKLREVLMFLTFILMNSLRQASINQQIPELLSLSRKSQQILEPKIFPFLHLRKSRQVPPGRAKFQLGLDRFGLHCQTHGIPNPLAV